MAAAPAKTTSTLRSFAGALAAAARQVSRPKFVAIVAGITVLAAVAIFVPVPSAVQLRDWAESVGPWFPLAFFLAHIGGTTAAAAAARAPLSRASTASVRRVPRPPACRCADAHARENTRKSYGVNSGGCTGPSIG